MNRARLFCVGCFFFLASCSGDEALEQEARYYGRTPSEWSYVLWVDENEGARTALDDLLSHGPEAAHAIVEIDAHRARFGRQPMGAEAFRLGSKAIPVFEEALRSNDRAHMIAGAVALSWYGADAIEAAEELASAVAVGVAESEDELILFATQALASMGPEAGDTVRGLASDNATRKRGLEIYRGWDILTWAYLDDLMTSDNEELAADAANLLADLKAARFERERVDTEVRAHTQPVLLDLPVREAIRISDENLRDLGLAGLSARQTLEKLLRLLHTSRDPRIRRLSAGILSNYERLAEPALPDLIKMLRAEDRHTRRVAMGTISAIGPVAAPAVPELLSILERDEQVERLSAAWALGQIGSASEPAWPFLLRLWEQRDPDSQLPLESGVDRMWAASTAMANIDSKRAIEDLSRDLDDPRWIVRRAIVEVFLIAGPQGYVALAEALEDTRPRVRRSAGLALMRLAGEDLDALEILARSSNDDPLLRPLVREARERTGIVAGSLVTTF